MAVSIQKANFWKRISAYMFDVVVLIALMLALMLGTNKIFKVEERIAVLHDYKIAYAQEEGIDLEISKEEYNAMTEEERSAYDEAVKRINAAMAEDEEVLEANMDASFAVLLSFTVAIFLATFILHFLFPLWFKYGRTLGKRMFGLAVIRTNCVKMTTPVLFIRSMVGVFAIETMFPLFILISMLFGLLGTVGIIVLVMLLFLQIFVLFRSPINASIHDLLTDSVVVEMASQKIYESQEELLAAKKAEALEQATAPETQVSSALFGNDNQ